MTGKVLAERKIPASEFGEGIALSGRDLVSLTWKAGIVRRWKVKSLLVPSADTLG